MTGKLPKTSAWVGGCLLMAAAVAAQVVTSSGYVPGGYGYSRPPYYGYGGYYGGGGAGSTPMGSYMAGMSQVIRAQGQYNLMSSAATINLEEAQKRDIENQAEWTNTYFEMRKVNEAYARSQRDPPLSPEALAQMAHAAAPARLAPTALDPVNGRIGWPSVLQNDLFATDRDTLEQLYARRAVMHGAIGDDTHRQIRAAVDATLEKLKDHIRDFDSRNYIEARNFLTSLGNESNFPTTAG